MALPLGHNSVDKNRIASFLKDIKAADDELASLKSAHMTRCKKPQKRIKGAMISAKAAGLDMAAFRTLVAEYRDRRRAEARRDKLEADEVASLDLLKAAVPDFFESTELGRASKRRNSGEAALDSLAT